MDANLNNSSEIEFAPEYEGAKMMTVVMDQENNPTMIPTSPIPMEMTLEKEPTVHVAVDSASAEDQQLKVVEAHISPPIPIEQLGHQQPLVDLKETFADSGKGDFKATNGHGEIKMEGSLFNGPFDMDKLSQVANNIPGASGLKKKQQQQQKEKTPTKKSLNSKIMALASAGAGDMPSPNDEDEMMFITGGEIVGADIAHVIRTAEEAGLIPPEARFSPKLKIRDGESGENSVGRKFFPLRGFGESTNSGSRNSGTGGDSQKNLETNLNFLSALAQGVIGGGGGRAQAQGQGRKSEGQAAGAKKSFGNTGSPKTPTGTTGVHLEQQRKTPLEKTRITPTIPSTSRLLRPTTSVSQKYSVVSPVGSSTDIGSGGGGGTPKAKTSRVSTGGGGIGYTSTWTPIPKTVKSRMGDAGAGGEGQGAAASPSGPATIKDQFGAFSRFGDATSDGKQITLSNCDKWMKQAHVIDGKKITTTDTSIAFKKLFKTSKKVGFEDFKRYVEDLATSKKLESKDILEKLTKCGAPGLSTATKAAHVGVVERLTDTSKYTGSHKERFDASGKGKGLEGRRDVADNSGYVAAFEEKLKLGEKGQSPAAK